MNPYSPSLRQFDQAACALPKSLDLQYQAYARMNKNMRLLKWHLFGLIAEVNYWTVELKLRKAFLCLQ